MYLCSGAPRRKPRYFFTVHDREIIGDPEGSEFATLDEVRAEALSSAGDLLRLSDQDGLWAGAEWKMVVTDETGNTVLTLRFSADPA